MCVLEVKRTINTKVRVQGAEGKSPCAVPFVEAQLTRRTVMYGALISQPFHPPEDMGHKPAGPLGAQFLCTVVLPAKNYMYARQL